MFKKLFRSIASIFFKIINFVKKHWKFLLIIMVVALLLYGFYYFAVICGGSFSMFLNNLSHGAASMISGLVNNPGITNIIRKSILPITLTALISKNKYLILIAGSIIICFMIISRIKKSNKEE